jgi:ubiquinone/menaquinone biosynthesis C-methylase UbiE
VIFHDEAHHVTAPIYSAAFAKIAPHVHTVNLSATLPDSKEPHYKYPLLKGIHDGVVRDFNLDLFLCVDTEYAEPARATALLELMIKKLLAQHTTVKLLIYTREANTTGADASSVHTFLAAHAAALRAHGWWVEGIKEDTEDRVGLLRGFEKSTAAVSILVSCRTLSEGIDLKGANCVLPWDPTASIVDNIQRIGRVLRLYKNAHGKILNKEDQTPSTVLVPVFLPAAEYEACGGDRAAIHALLEKQIAEGERGNFRPIVNVCTALKSELAEDDAELFNALLNYPHKPKVTVDRGLVECVAKACKKSAEDVLEEVAVALEEKELDEVAEAVREGEWSEEEAGDVVAALADTQGITLVVRDGDEAEMFGNGAQVVTVEKHGEGYKPVKNGTKKAAADMEVARKRVAHRMRVAFSDECQVLLGLDSVEGADTTGGMILSRLTTEVHVDEKWEARRLEWVAMYEKLGRCPSTTATDLDEKRAFIWQSNQRRLHVRNKLNLERIIQLENSELTPGWSWGYDSVWEEHRQNWITIYNLLKRFPKQGSSNNEEMQAGRWQTIQRQHYHKKSIRLTQKRIKILEEDTPGWQWDERDSSWENHRQHWLSVYLRLQRSPNHSSDDKIEAEAGLWQSNQRYAYKKKASHLTPERIEKLEKKTPGWKWDIDKWEYSLQHWKLQFQLLQRYPSHHASDIEEKKAGRWQQNQRHDYKKSATRLTIERIATLNATPGWSWSADESPVTPYIPATPADTPTLTIDNAAVADTIQHVPAEAPPLTIRKRKVPKAVAEKPTEETPAQKVARQRSALEEYHKRFKSMNADTYTSTIAKNPTEFSAYHDVADTYDARDLLERQPLKKIAAMLAPLNKPSYTAIDLGCGRNRLRNLSEVSRMKWTSVDVHAADDTVTVADMGALPYEDDSYDIAVLSRSLWARNHEAVLRETQRILKVGGRAVICESFQRWLLADGQNELLQCLRSLGFEVMKEDGTRVSDITDDVFQYIIVRKSESSPPSP